MTRYIVHLRNKGFNAKNSKDLLLRARNLAGSDVIVRDSRVSTKYIEFDITIPNEEIQDLLIKLSNITPIANYMEIVETEMEKENSIEFARSLFNDERYWECHEVLESVWRKETGNEKNLLQGIILTCAGFVHSQKDEDDTCVSILGRAMEKLNNAMGMYYGIDIDRFKRLVLNIIDTRIIHHFKV